MQQRLTPATALLLIVPPTMWAGNAVIGRAAADLVAPITLNFLRWAVALIFLIPFGYKFLAPGSDTWRQWRRYAILGLCGVGLYNSLQYMALHTSTAVNVTLVAASMPVWMLIVGRMFYGVGIHKNQVFGSILSLVGVAIVLAQGQWSELIGFRFVIGDLLMVLATIIWAFYSWQLTKVPPEAPLRSHWSGFLIAQVVYGVAWSGIFAGMEYSLDDWYFEFGWPLVFTVAYVAIGPAIIAFRCWGAGVQRVGPTLAGFFNNLTPLIAAVLSLALLGEKPHLYHAIAFALIIGGIFLSSKVQGLAK